jgi:hypothetical protein
LDGSTVQDDLAFRPFKLPKRSLVVQLLCELTKKDSPFEALRGLSYLQLKVYRRLDEGKPKESIELHESLETVSEHPEYKIPFIVVAIPHQSGK